MDKAVMVWVRADKRWLGEYAKKPKKRASSQQQEEAAFGNTVVFIPVRCPQCGSRRIKWYGRSGKIRYCLCRTCGVKFKALEKQG